VRLAGSVVFSDQPIADASLTAIDLATGKAIDLKAWSDTPGKGATGTQRTDAKGAFDVELPKLADDQIVKLMATAGSQTFTALFDARGRAVGAAGAQGASYRLAQGRAVSITIRLKLTASTTAAAKAFEGAIKLTFQLPKEAQQAERDAALAAAEQAAKDVEAAIAAKPELASGLVVSVGADGEVRDLDAFRSTIAKLGVFDTLFAAVQDRLVAVTAQKLMADGQLAAITAEDFPLDRVSITQGGGLSFTGGQTTVGGQVANNFVPTPERNRRRAAPTEEGPAAEDAPFSGFVPKARGLTVYGNVAGAAYYTLSSAFDYGGNLYAFNAEGEPVGNADLGAIYPSGLGALPSSTTIMVSSFEPQWGIYRYRRNGDATYTQEAAGSSGVPAVGGVVAANRYWAFSGTDFQNPGREAIRSWALTGDLSASETLQLGTADLNIASALPGVQTAWALAVQADGTSTRVYWVDQGRRLYRYQATAATPTAEVEVIKQFSGYDYYGGVAAAGTKLYVATGGSVYVIDDPTVASPAIQADPIASYTGLAPLGGAQTRPGSVVFAFSLTNDVQRFAVP
jgi:hypothetical protein